MGYCPYVYRSAGSPLYLPVPLDSRTISIPSRISRADAPFRSGIIATGAVKDKTTYALNGTLTLGNPQNGNAQMTTTADMYERIAQMTQFFLGRSSLSFALVIAETGLKVSYTNPAAVTTEFEFPPLDTDLIYTDCIALTFGVTWDNATKGIIKYALSFTAPNRSIT